MRYRTNYRQLLIFLLTILITSFAFAQDSLNMTCLSFRSEPGAQGWNARRYGNMCYVGTYTGFYAYDVTNLYSPVLRATIPPINNGGGEICRPNLSVVYYWNPQGFSIISIENPQAPVRVGSFLIPDIASYKTDKAHLYVACRTGGLKIYDIQNPLVPQLVCTFQTLGLAEEVDLDGHYVYVGNRNGYVEFIDVINPLVPVRVGSILIEGLIRRIHHAGNMLYCAGYERGITIVDKTNLSSPTQVARWNTQFQNPAMNALLSNGNLFVADGWGGFEVLNVANPLNPVQIGFYRRATSSDFTVKNNVIYSANYSGGFGIYRYNPTDSTTPYIHLENNNGSDSTHRPQDTLAIGQIDTIRWSTNNFGDDSVSIKINYNYPTGFWQDINPLTPNDGEEIWVVTQPITNNARILVCSASRPEYLDISDHNFSIVNGNPPRLFLNSHNSGEQLVLGQLDTVLWSSEYFTDEYVQVSINYNYPTGPWTPLFTAPTLNNSSSWMVTGPVTNRARLLVTGLSQTFIRDLSDSNFSIVDLSPAIRLVNHNQPILLETGQFDTIRWATQNFSDDSVTIRINRNYPTGDWVTLGTYETSPLSTVWCVTGPISTNARLMISARTNPTIMDLCDTNFAIILGPPSLRLESHNLPDSLFIGRIDTIRWSTENFLDDSVTVRINRNYPVGDWISLFNAATSVDHATWVVSGPISSNTRFMVSAYHQFALMDISDTNVVIAEDLTSVLNIPTPERFEVSKAYPNPFNSMVTLTLTISQAEHTTVEILNELGQRVEVLNASFLPSGKHNFHWSASTFPSGTYFYRIDGKSIHQLKPIQLIR